MSENKSTVTITSEGITTTVISKEGISIINEGLGEISFKLSNEKTPQDVRDQGEQHGFILVNNPILDISENEDLYIDRANIRLKSKSYFHQK